ncbi:MAG: aminoacyl-tRNA hydrolase [Gammaproteobacteria bacterium]|nr:aminoacyl-tRNA hydrolase [Gammaproteobacteria bacterium]
MQDKIQLIVGLGNPGPNYKATRHNAGAWFVEMLAQDNGIELKPEAKFGGRIGRIQIQQQEYWLLLPTTFMNRSGLSIKSMANFYKIPPEAILVAHDELDFPPGTIRFKQEGGHGGHNGLRDIIQQLQTKNFHRLRIGIGHPGHRDQVTDYVLNSPSKKDFELIIDSIVAAQKVLPSFLVGEFQQAIRLLHNE